MKTLQEIQEIRESTRKSIRLEGYPENSARIVVGMATCGIAAGARPVLDALTDEIAKRNSPNVTVTQTGCIGICQYEPVVEVYMPGQEKVTYIKMTPEKAVRIVNEHIINRNPVAEFTIGAAN